MIKGLRKSKICLTFERKALIRTVQLQHLILAIDVRKQRSVNFVTLSRTPPATLSKPLLLHYPLLVSPISPLSRRTRNLSWSARVAVCHEGIDYHLARTGK